MIYLDHNATTPLHPKALEAMEPYLRGRWANPSSPYRFGQEARAAVDGARARIADAVGCRPAELVFTSGGTEADNLALRGVRGGPIVTTAIEHHAVLNTCKALESEGRRVTYVPVRPTGVVDMSALAENLTPETVLVSVMHANNETGVLQPVEEIGRMARSRGILFHTDAVQTAGKLPGRLADLGADLVSISAHKLYGPKGIGALYVREGTSLHPILTGGPHERGLRAGTEDVAAIVGFAEAMALACEAADAESRRLGELRDRFERRVTRGMGGVKINGAQAPRVPNTSSLSFQSVDGESIVLDLDLQGICVSTGSACATGEPEPSHVLLAMGLSEREAQGTARVSLGKDTRPDDLDKAAEALTRCVERLRRISSEVRI
ncbi:MAG: cysteine desulfurase family protein [Elusimicrobiota bacterium]